MSTNRRRAVLAQAQADLAIEESLETKVPPGFKQVHVNRLYDRVGTVTYGDITIHDPYEYGTLDTNHSVTWDRAVELVELLPPIATVLRKGSGWSFQTAAYVASVPDEKKARDVITDVEPILMKIGATPRDGRDPIPWLRLEWYTMIEGIGVVEVEVHLGRPPAYVIAYETYRTKCFGGVMYRDTRLLYNANLDVSTTCELVARRATIGWGGGGDEYPKDFTVYWEHVGLTLNGKPALTGKLIVEYLARLVQGEPLTLAEGESRYRVHASGRRVESKDPAHDLGGDVFCEVAARDEEHAKEVFLKRVEETHEHVHVSKVVRVQEVK